MSDGKRTWKYGDITLTEDQVEILDADWYIRENLSALRELFGMMERESDAQGGDIIDPMGVSGRIGGAMTRDVNQKTSEFFGILSLKGYGLFVVLATQDTPGVPTGTLIDTFVENTRR